MRRQLRVTPEAKMIVEGWVGEVDRQGYCVVTLDLKTVWALDQRVECDDPIALSEWILDADAAAQAWE